MFQKLSRHLTPSTAIAFIALVFALTGGAFAATGGSGSGGSPAKATASFGHNTTVAIAAKKKKTTSTRGPAGPKGATGATGPAGTPGATGPAGSAGPQGLQGTAGTNGTDGTNGTPGKEGEKGKEGSPWTAGGTLPSKRTETGSWNISATKENNEVASTISFTIPLAKTLSATAVHYVNKTGTEEVTFNETTHAFGVAPTTSCLGTAAEPTAAPGNLCLYQSEAEGVEDASSAFAEAIIRPTTTKPLELTQGAATSGTLLLLKRNEEEASFAYGTWAVTAP